MAEHSAIIIYSSGSEERLEQAYVNTPHTASTLLDEGIYDEAGLKEAMQKAILVCLQVQIPVRRHFRRIHIHDTGGRISEDWALSDFAY